MGPEKIAQVRQVIAHEKANTDETSRLNVWLLERAVRLHHMIELPEGHEFETLAAFVLEYVDFLPECLDQFHSVAARAGISEYTDLFLDIAVDFLLSPPQGVEHSPGIGHLIDEAFMAHRILEELNDRCYGYLGGPAMPADTSYANIVIHSLIGDAFANELDLVVQYAIEANQDKERAVMAKLNRTEVQSLGLAGKEWPLFGEHSSVAIKFRF